MIPKPRRITTRSIAALARHALESSNILRQGDNARVVYRLLQGQALDSPQPITAGPQPWLGPMVRTGPGAIAVFMTWEGPLTGTTTEYGYAIWASHEECLMLFLAYAKLLETMARVA